MNISKKLLVALFGLLVVPVFADVRLPSVISSHMVVQREMPIRIWGWADPLENITIDFAGNKYTVIADHNGDWKIELPAMKAGGPYDMTITALNTIQLTDILIGEVWLCSGQSNMEVPLYNAEDIANANHSSIRLFKVHRRFSFHPTEYVDAKWKVCNPENIEKTAFTAVGYFFGRKLNQKLNVPFGLIDASWGGTGIQSWTPFEALANNPQLISQLDTYKNIVANLEDKEKEFQFQLAQYNKIRPLVVEAEANRELAKEISGPEFDDSDWLEMDLPKRWEDANLPDYDGLVWFRKKINIPGNWQGKGLVLHLGPIDEIDVTFFNGVEVGRTGSFKDETTQFWGTNREYKIPAEIVAAGENIIAVRVIDSAYYGGIWGPEPEKMKITTADSGESVPLAGKWKYKDYIRITPKPVQLSSNPCFASVLYNGMIHPLTPFSIRGAIWYQGESNVGDGMLYYEMMKALIGGWRDVFNEPEMPFYFVQIAPFKYNSDSELPEIWRAQIKTVQEVPNTGIASTMDIGNIYNIHPENKLDVGKRLALWALAKTYGFDGIVYSGPIYKSMTIEGNNIRIQFDYVGSGLVSRDGNDLNWFEIAGEDGKYIEANAVIDGDSVVVSSPKVKKPANARFAWHMLAEPNFMNKEGLPALPFRTDK